MADTEKCFCHLNGYKVKDADARAAIEEINRDHPNNTGVINYLTALAENPENEGKIYGIHNEEIVVIDPPVTDTSALQQTVEQHSTQINGIISDVQKNSVNIAANTGSIENLSSSVSQHGTQINGIISEQQQQAATIAKNETAIAAMPRVIVVDSVDSLPADAEDGTIAFVASAV